MNLFETLKSFSSYVPFTTSSVIPQSVRQDLIKGILSQKEIKYLHVIHMDLLFQNIPEFIREKSSIAIKEYEAEQNTVTNKNLFKTNSEIIKHYTETRNQLDEFTKRVIDYFISQGLELHSSDLATTILREVPDNSWQSAHHKKVPYLLELVPKPIPISSTTHFQLAFTPSIDNIENSVNSTLDMMYKQSPQRIIEYNEILRKNYGTNYYE